MATKKITALDQATNAAQGDNDLVPIIVDPSGTPITKKTTLSRIGVAPKSFLDELAAGQVEIDAPERRDLDLAHAVGPREAARGERWRGHGGRTPGGILCPQPPGGPAAPPPSPRVRRRPENRERGSPGR